MTNISNPIHITLDPIEFDSPSSVVEASKLTGANIQMLKNLLSQCMNDIALLQTDPVNEKDYFCKVAYIKGEIAAYSHLINSHIEAHQTTQEH